jgi:fructokinase
MSTESLSAPRGVLCLGEALVDMICEQPVEDLSQAGAFAAHFGGAVANVAVVAARAGAPVALAGGAGEDVWGRWLRGTLTGAGVDVSRFALIEGLTTPMALVTVDHAGEAAYTIYGESIGTIVHALGDAVEDAVAGAGGLFISSNTLVGEAERSVTMRAREQALALGRPLIFDPNLRLHRWSSRTDAAFCANACVPGALLVRLNAAEAALLTGEDDVERAAAALVKAGARMVVVTLGAAGAILRGALRADQAAVEVPVRSTIGAGDAVTGTLVARLALSDFYEPAVAAGLRAAVAAGAAACERWGAVD